MKRFLRRLNRGLVLAALVLVGLVIFITVDNTRFKKSKPEIQKQVEEYLKEVKRVNLESGKRKAEEAQTLMEKTWCNEGNGLDNNYTLFTKDEGLSYLKTVENMGGDRNTVIDYTDIIRSVSIEKSGPGCARATVAYEASLGFEHALDSDGYRIYGLQSDGYYFGYGGEQQEEEHRRLNISYSLSFLLYEKDGQWKIGGLGYDSMDA